MKLSVIIPAFNEAGEVGRTVRHVLNTQDRALVSEVIVADGGSTDDTMREAQDAGAVVIRATRKGRAAQMNAGASIANATILYFLHAETRPPIGFASAIVHAVESNSAAGCFRLRFDRDHWALRLKAWFTRFNATGFHYGDQSLFVTRSLFDTVGGYDEDKIVFEDLDMVERLARHTRFTVLTGPIITSARKYDRNSYLRMQLTFYRMYTLYRLGADQERLVKAYKQMVRQDKI